MGVKVIWLHIPHVAHRVNKAVRWVREDGHGAPIADKESKGMPLAGVTPGLKNIMHHLEVDLYICNKV